MKRLISMLMVMILVISLFPVQAFASELENDGTQPPIVTEESTPEESASEESEPTEESAAEEEIPAEEPAAEEEVPAGEPAAEEEVPSEENTSEEGKPAEEPSEEAAGRTCLDGCILVGEDEHLENGGECFVWIPCTATEGCEGSEGHEGECYGIATYAEGTILSISGRNYRNVYVVVNETLYYVNSNGVIVNTDGTEAFFEPGSYAIYYGLFSSWGSSFAQGTAQVEEGTASVSVTLRSASVGTNTDFATRVLYATSLYYNTSSFNHVDLRVAATYEINIGNHTYTAAVYNPSVVVKVGGQQVASNSWPGTTSYEWRREGLNLTKSSVITVELTLDLHYTDSSGVTHTMEDIVVVYDNVNDVDKFIDAIAICDMVWGLDFRVDVEEIQEVIEYHTVSYEWKVYHTDGTYTNLPAGAPSAPAATSGHEAGTYYTYDTGFVAGTSFYDYDNGLLYTFHGWDTYSHSAAYNPIPGTGYYSLESNSAIEITGDTYIYGYWTVTELEPAAAHISIEKVFIVDGVEMTPAEAEDLWFRIDTGIDRDSDGDTTVDVDYSMLLASNGEYKIPVYQYDTPFRFTEHNADIPGYTRTTTIQVSGSYITGSSQSGDSVTVSMQPVYTGENVHLGTVTYVNTYTKIQGAPIQVYPTMNLVKSAADTRLAQEGVAFTLYADEACTAPITTVITGSGGLVNLDFGAIEGIAPGTYYLKETQPLDGYYADPFVYPITLAETGTAEELRDGEYIRITYYGLSIAVPEGSAAAYDGSNRLHIFDAPVLGSFHVSKSITGMAEEDQNNLSAVVIVHGPISRDASGNIASIGNTWQLELTSENGWAAEIADLPLGEYLIHESFASVHGYTWTNVTYGDLPTTVYNGITSGIFRVENETPVTLKLTNTYEEWTEADFYIKKVDENGNALAGAVFTLSTDEAGTNVIATGTTGPDGYTHFSGYTVPEAQSSVTYYLRETKAPAGYYLSNQVYQVVITAVTKEETGKTGFESQISLVSGRNSGFDISTDLLTVTNYPVVGNLTITKTFIGDMIPEGLDSISVRIGGPNGYSRIVELRSENGWTATVDGLLLGEYTVTELDANVPGYSWEVLYSAETITLAEAEPGMSVPGTEISGSTVITNRYTRNEEIYEVPTSLTVKKVGENGEPLAGAVFTLSRMGTDGKTVVSSVSYTTGADGIVVFDLLSGSIVNGAAVEGTYILAETKAPAGYAPSSSTWTVTILEDDGQLRWTLNENENVYEGYWEWIVGSGNLSTYQNGVLTVRNLRSRGNLTIEKNVTDPLGLYADAVYAFTLDCSDDAFDKTFTLKAGESITIENIPWGTTYTLTENTTGAAFTSTIADGGNGRIWAAETRITVTNTYAYTTHNQPLALVKVDAADPTQVIPGAGFTLYADELLTTKVGQEVFSDTNGQLQLPIEIAGTYYLAETTAPKGYHTNAQVYVVTAEEKIVVLEAGTENAVTQIQMHIRIAGLTGTTENQIDYTYMIENTAIKAVEVSVEKVWNDGGYYARPESVKITLYRDGEAYETVTLSAENNWSYTWEGLTDEYTWTVDETNVPEGYTKTVTRDGDSWTVTNSRTPNPVAITVTKAWQHNGGKHLPDSITVTLYRNGEAYNTITLTEKDGWTHTWTGLDDTAQWSVDETDIPEGYTKAVAVNGYDFVITNSRIIQPVEVTVTKVWVASEGVVHPESVEVILYRDGEAYETVTLSAENNWSYTWESLTDEYTWTVDETNVPEGYTKTVTNDGNNWTITNTKDFTYIDISVTKVWYGADVAHPTSIEVTLYRNGEAYETVTLSAENNWSYTWENLTDEFTWTVDEPSVPSGYAKTVRQSGYSFTIVNTHVDNPKTGDFADLMGMGTMMTLGLVGMAICLMALLVPKKKEEI